MGYAERRTWVGTGSDGLPRASRRPCEYMVYVPDLLVGQRLVLPSEIFEASRDTGTLTHFLDLHRRLMEHTGRALIHLILRCPRPDGRGWRGRLDLTCHLA